MTNKTFREDYIDERGSCIYCFCYAVVFTFMMAYFLVSEEYLGFAIELAACIVFYAYGWIHYDKMKKAKRNIVFDDFLKPDQP